MDDPFPHAQLTRTGRLKAYKNLYSGFSSEFKQVSFCKDIFLRKLKFYWRSSIACHIFLYYNDLKNRLSILRLLGPPARNVLPIVQ